MLEKSRFERDIATLRERNADMNLLRTNINALETRSRPQSLPNDDARTIVARLSKVRLASRLLHDTLKDTWSCSDQSHVQHWVKLCVGHDTDSRSDVIALDMAISSEVSAQSHLYVTHLQTSLCRTLIYEYVFQ